jgi:mono/diheme cytochrome c family protein
MKNPLNIFLLLVLLLVLGLNWVLWRDPSVPNEDVLPDMAYSPAYKAQAENTAIAGGNTALRPVVGTVARDYPPLSYGASPEEAQRAGRELANPFGRGDVKAAERGAAVYANFCAVCHGPAGLGDGTITTRGFPPPPSLFAENAINMADGQMFHIITFGQRNMPGYASQVSRADRWQAILHIRSLQQKNSKAAQQTAPVAAVTTTAETKEVRP